MKWNSLKPFKKLLVSSGGSTAGRNSAGRITIFHRGGGAKRLQRNVDLKRNTSAMGVVERIEYDPNRSARVALVRWIEGVHPGNQRECQKHFAPPEKVIDPVAATVVGQFPLACLTPGHLARGGAFSNKEGGKLNSVKDVFVSAFGSQRAKNESLSRLPRVAVAGSKPAVYFPQATGEEEKLFSLTDVQRWRKDSVLWEHRLKPKAAVSWLNFVREEPIGLVQAVYKNETKAVGKSSTKTKEIFDPTPLTYIIASNEMKPGTMVMNCNLPKQPAHK